MYEGVVFAALSDPSPALEGIFRCPEVGLGGAERNGPEASCMASYGEPVPVGEGCLGET